MHTSKTCTCAARKASAEHMYAYWKREAADRWRDLAETGPLFVLAVFFLGFALDPVELQKYFDRATSDLL